MDVDIQEDKKQIKLLELAVQHGERLGKAVLCVRSGRDGGGAGVEKSRF